MTSLKEEREVSDDDYVNEYSEMKLEAAETGDETGYDAAVATPF